MTQFASPARLSEKDNLVTHTELYKASFIKLSRGILPANARKTIDPESLPEYSKRILSLRGKRRQGQFARSLGVSPMAVSHWERGTNEPGSKMYLKLAQMAEGASRDWFSKRGHSEEAELAMQLLSPRRGKHIESFIGIPFQAGGAGAGSGRVHEADEEQGEIFVPRHLCPSPGRTRCIEAHGKSMEPLIGDRVPVAIDSSQSNLLKLRGKVVAAQHNEEGVVIKRLIQLDGRWLLVAEAQGYEPIELVDGWRIVGRAIWWIHLAD